MIYINPLIRDLERVPQPEGRGKYVRLDQNENPDGIPQWLFDEVYKKITPEFLSIYPEETKLTQKYADFFGLKLENVTLTCGSVVGMGYVIKVFGEPKKDLICVSPSFGMYGVYAESIGMNVKTLSYENDYTFKIEKILDSINENTGIVALVNPNMPMGNVYSEQEIVSVIENASKFNALVIIDEAYYYFYDKSSLELVKKYDNVVLLRTFSKMLSVPALRLGVIIGSKEIIHCINNYKPHYTVNSIALLFGEAIIDNHDKLVKELTEKFMAGKEWFFSALKENGYPIIDSEGCFVCVKPKHKSTEYITEKLKENGILILCGKGALAGFLRVTIWDKKYMKIFMDELLKLDVEN